jgi:hypothetical protein
MVPLQQPAQLAGPHTPWQTPLWHVFIAVQDWQAAPLRPHWLLPSDPIETHAFPLQHPVQLAALQPASALTIWHEPPTHACPVPQDVHDAAPTPQWVAFSWTMSTHSAATQQPVQLKALQPAPPTQVPPWQDWTPWMQFRH